MAGHQNRVMADDVAPPGTVAVQRALALLRCFEDGPAEQRLSDLARATDLSVSTAHRLLGALCADGFLEQDQDTERYRLGPTVVRLGLVGRPVIRRHDVQAVLQGLTASTGESATLAVREGDEVVVVAASTSHRQLRFEHGIGSRLAAHASAMGKVLLAAGTTDLTDEVRRLPKLARFTPETITSRTALAADLRVTRRRGWATNVEERFEGVSGVAAAVLDDDGAVVAAIGVQGPTQRVDTSATGETIRAVVEAAEQLRGVRRADLSI